MFREQKTSNPVMFESLESRKLMSVTGAVLTNGVLTVNADTAGDNIRIVRTGAPSVRGQPVLSTIAVRDRDVLKGTFLNRLVQSIVVDGAGGNDFLDARSAGRAVNMNGGAGNDILYGGPGNDRLDGGADSDWCIGGAGNDSLIGGLGGDFLLGDEGNDDINALQSSDGTADYIDGGAGSDTLRIFICDHNNTVRNVESFIYSAC